MSGLTRRGLLGGAAALVMGGGKPPGLRGVVVLDPLPAVRRVFLVSPRAAMTAEAARIWAEACKAWSLHDWMQT